MLSGKRQPSRRHRAGGGPPCPARAVPTPRLQAPLSRETATELVKAERVAYAAYLSAYAVWRKSQCSDARLQQAVSAAYRMWLTARRTVQAGQLAAPALFAPSAALFNAV